MIGVCPGCGKPFRIEKAKGDEGLVYCVKMYASARPICPLERG